MCGYECDDDWEEEPKLVDLKSSYDPINANIVPGSAVKRQEAPEAPLLSCHSIFGVHSNSGRCPRRRLTYS
jgi:hypothetical protein